MHAEACHTYRRNHRYMYALVLKLCAHAHCIHAAHPSTYAMFAVPTYTGAHTLVDAYTYFHTYTNKLCNTIQSTVAISQFTWFGNHGCQTQHDAIITPLSMPIYMYALHDNDNQPITYHALCICVSISLVCRR